MATFQIITSPIGSQYTESIGQDDPADLNDFDVYLVANENVTGLTQSDCSVNNNATIVSLEGENSVYKVGVRPEANVARVVTFTIAADAVTEGNPETTADIRVSTSFPDTDAEAATLLFDANYSGIAVSPTRILLSGGTEGMHKFTHDGTEVTSESQNVGSQGVGKLDYFNGTFLVTPNSGATRRYPLTGNTVLETYAYTAGAAPSFSTVHTRFGILFINRTNRNFHLLPYGGVVDDVTTFDRFPPDFAYMAYQNDLLYLAESTASKNIGLAEIVDEDNIQFLMHLNISAPGSFYADCAIYRDTLYLFSGITNNRSIYTLDIRKYRPMAKNTKALIHPVIITGDTTIDCTQYAPDADTLIFDVGFDLPSYLSMSNNVITVDTSALTTPTTCFVMLKGINYVDATETGVFGFYLIILPATAPVWNSVTELSMRADSTYNLHLLVDADSIAFRSGRTQPTGSSISDGILTIGTASGTAELTATKDGLDSHKSIAIDVIQAQQNLRGTRTRYKVEIAGIDVSADLLNAPTISEQLDPIVINETRINEATIELQGVAKYDQNRAGNFWTTNSLNAGGFQETVKVYTEHLVSGTWTENLLFSGIILESSYPVDSASFRLSCVDASHILQNTVPREFGRLEKWAETRKTTEEATFEGTYAPNDSLLPIQPFSGQAWTDRTALTLAMLSNQSEGVIPANTGYLTAQDFRTAGGFVETNPILNYLTLPRAAEIELLMKQLSVGENHAYNIEIDLTGKTVDMPYILNRGNVPRNVQDIRNTLIVKDWVYDTTATRILMLLSNPENHLQDRIVQYSLSENAYQVLHVFDKDIKSHRIERRNSTNYYILTSAPITQDRSRTETPRQSDKTALGYDSVAEGSVIRIHHYNASTNTLTEHVDEDDTRPPQLGIHYWVGFENAWQIDEYEGVRPDYRSAFRWYSNNLYYRYAVERKFGVARVNTSGTTTELTDSPRVGDWDHLNFAFDISDIGTVFWGFVNDGTLTVEQRTSGGTTSTVWTGTASDGRYLGVLELLYDKENVYMVVSIQQYETGTTTLSRSKTARAILCRVNVSGTPALTTLKEYDFVHCAACNLTVYDNDVHFVEGLPACRQYTAYNPDLDSYDSDQGLNPVPENDGKLFKIDGTDIEDLGFTWYDERPFNVYPARMITVGDDLHIQAGYGDIDELLKSESLASQADNFAHLVFGETLRYILPTFTPNSSIHAELSTLAKNVNAVVSFERGIISVKDRLPFRAMTDGATGTGTGNLDFDGSNKPFPSSGYLIIGNEILGYTGVSSGAFTGITRGVLGTSITNHANNSRILYLDNVIQGTYLSLSLVSDTNRVYNIIRNSDLTVEVRDTTSIAQYGERAYTLDLGLTRHENEWIESIFNEYLAELKDLQDIVNLQLTRDIELLLGDVIPFEHEGTIKAMRIVSLRDEQSRTTIRGRTITV